MKKAAPRLANRKRGSREKSIHVAFATVDSKVVAVETNDREKGHAEARLVEKLKTMDIGESVDVTVVRVANTSRSDNIVFSNSRPCMACRECLLRNASAINLREVGWSTASSSIAVSDWS